MENATDTRNVHAPDDAVKSATKQSQPVFCINAYRDLILEGIMQVYPTAGIRNHWAKVLGDNIGNDLPLLAGGKNDSFNQIKHDILRKRSEPQIYFNIVCVSTGCPRLRTEACTAETFQINPATKIIDLSPILDWFATDFESTQLKQLRYLSKFVPDLKTVKLKVYRVIFLPRYLLPLREYGKYKKYTQSL